MAEVIAKQGESIADLLRRFRWAVNKADILPEFKRRSYFLKPSARRRRKEKRARRRGWKRQRQNARRQQREVA